MSFLLPLVLLPSIAWSAGNQLPADSPEQINYNLRELYDQVSKIDAISGIRVGTTTVNISSAGVVISTASGGTLAGITFPDGTFQATAATNTFTQAVTFNSSVTINGFFGRINESTWTYLTVNFTTTSANLNNCVPGSSITMTTDASYAEIILDAVSIQSNSTERAGISALLDGDFLTPHTVSSPMTRSEAATGAEIKAFYHYVTTATISAASHTACITMNVGGGATGTLTCPCRFMFREYH